MHQKRTPIRTARYLFLFDSLRHKTRLSVEQLDERVRKRATSLGHCTPAIDTIKSYFSGRRYPQLMGEMNSPIPWLAFLELEFPETIRTASNTFWSVVAPIHRPNGGQIAIEHKELELLSLLFDINSANVNRATRTTNTSWTKASEAWTNLDRINNSLARLPNAERFFTMHVSGFAERSRLAIEREIDFALALQTIDRLGALTALSLEAREIHDPRRAERLMQPILETYDQAATIPGMRRAKDAVFAFLSENCLTVSACVVQVSWHVDRKSLLADGNLLQEWTETPIIICGRLGEGWVSF